MGREIRMVPKGWEHPRDERTGNYLPMIDKTWEDAMDEYILEYQEWKIKPREGYEDLPYHEWAGDPPGADYHRPAFESEATCYQVYQTVSEGTPTSPVFETEDEMIVWLIGQGHSEHAAREFVKTGWVMSGLVIPGQGFYSNIDSFDAGTP